MFTHNLHTQLNLLTRNLPTHTQLAHTHTHLSVALGDIDLHFAWQAWHLVTSTFTLRGRRGAWWHRPSLCVAGVALMALGWLWRRAWVLWCGCLRGRRGTWWHRPSLCVAGVALGDIDLHFAWQAWHVWHWAGSGGALGYFGAAVCVAGVALGDIDLHFAWQAWHLATSTFTLRGRCGTWWHGRALCGQVWHWWHWTGSGGALGNFGRRGCLCGRRGTWRRWPSLCVAGVGLMALDWLRWHTKLFHPFTHTELCHTQLFDTQLCHTQLFHTQLFYTRLCHIQLFHTQHFYIHKLTHTTLSHTALSPNLSCTISFVIIGRSWFVGLSGPLIKRKHLSESHLLTK